MRWRQVKWLLKTFACIKNNAGKPGNNSNHIANTDSMKLKITIGSAVFTATFQNIETIGPLLKFKEMIKH